jgi:Asp/Glu/hydantoin racemase
LALISTDIGIVPIVSAYVRQLSPSTDIVNLIDDGVTGEIMRNENSLAAGICKRLMHLIYAGEHSGAGAILITCAAISELADYARPFVKAPIFKLDEPMMRRAVDIGENIGIIATAQAAANPAARQINAIARARGKKIHITGRLVSNAHEPWRRGETALHNEIVCEAVKELIPVCDVIVMAQASMLGAVSALSEEHRAKTLTSPYLGVSQVFDRKL